MFSVLDSGGGERIVALANPSIGFGNETPELLLLALAFDLQSVDCFVLAVDSLSKFADQLVSAIIDR